jgi:Rrf2 family protein
LSLAGRSSARHDPAKTLHRPVKLSVKVDYACRVLVQLARMDGREGLAHIEELARIEAVPATYLVQILGELRNGGLITSRRGKQGGYALARPPAAISLLDIVTLIEGDVLDLGGAAEGASGKRVAQAWREVRAVLAAKCAEVTLEKLAAKAGGEMYYI